MSQVRVRGLAEFRRDLPDSRAVDKEMRRGYSRVASKMQSKARSNATAGGGAFAASRTAIRGNSTVRSASLGVSSSGRNPFAEATFWGTRKRTGWYAAGRYADSTGQQFPEWVGVHWEAAQLDQGPYVLNYTIAENRDVIDDELGQAVDDMFAAAFTD